jgi:hypothetical protein
MGGWMGCRASLDMVEKRKIPSPCQELNPNQLHLQTGSDSWLKRLLTKPWLLNCIKDMKSAPSKWLCKEVKVSKQYLSWDSHRFTQFLSTFPLESLTVGKFISSAIFKTSANHVMGLPTTNEHTRLIQVCLF